MYIARHDVPGVSPKELADAHALDVEVQHKHGVRYYTYWFDPEDRGELTLKGMPEPTRAYNALRRE